MPGMPLTRALIAEGTRGLVVVKCPLAPLLAEGATATITRS
jgi:hypothetical protein